MFRYPAKKMLTLCGGLLVPGLPASSLRAPLLLPAPVLPREAGRTSWWGRTGPGRPARSPPIREPRSSPPELLPVGTLSVAQYKHGGRPGATSQSSHISWKSLLKTLYTEEVRKDFQINSLCVAPAASGPPVPGREQQEK